MDNRQTKKWTGKLMRTMETYKKFKKKILLQEVILIYNFDIVLIVEKIMEVEIKIYTNNNNK